MINALPFVQALIEMVVSRHARPVPVRVNGRIGGMRRYEVTDVGEWVQVSFGRDPAGWYPARDVTFIHHT